MRIFNRLCMNTVLWISVWPMSQTEEYFCSLFLGNFVVFVGFVFESHPKHRVAPPWSQLCFLTINQCVFLLCHLRRLQVQPPSGRLFPRCWRSQRASLSLTLLILTQLLTPSLSVHTLNHRCVPPSFTLFMQLVLEKQWYMFRNLPARLSVFSCTCVMHECLKTADFPVCRSDLRH